MAKHSRLPVPKKRWSAATSTPALWCLCKSSCAVLCCAVLCCAVLCWDHFDKQKVIVALQMQHYYAYSASFPANLYQRTVAMYDLDYHHEVYISPRSQDISLQQERVLVQDAPI